MTAVILALRWWVALILFVAGVTKIGDVERVGEAVARYGVMPRWFVRPTAMLLPAIELTLAAALALGFLPSIAGGLACVLFAGFAVAIVWNLVHGRRFDCGCGTGAESMISWGLALRDAALAALGLLIAIGPSGGLAVWPVLVHGSGHASVASTLIPVPMIVILLAAASRLRKPSGEEWRAFQQIRTSRRRSTAELSEGEV